MGAVVSGRIPPLAGLLLPAACGGTRTYHRVPVPSARWLGVTDTAIGP